MDPVILYMLSSLTPSHRTAYLPTYMHILLRASMLNAGELVQADDFSCAAVWMPPGTRVDHELTLIQTGFLGLAWSLGFSGTKRMLWDYQRQADAFKARALRDPRTGRKVHRYHYLWFIGTAVEARGRGLAC